MTTLTVTKASESVSMDLNQNQGEVKMSDQKNNQVSLIGGRAVMTKADVSYIPKEDPLFVPNGHYKNILKIINSGLFYPTFITGLSGIGKTAGIFHACSVSKRELIRVNLTEETDEDDLLGGMRLIDGETVWQDGLVVEAMRRGAVLLLDEIDLASTKIMCLQAVLEGKPIVIKSNGVKVEPEAGFTIFATANTKGKGNDDGQFVGTNVMNEAFLDRFPITFEALTPTKSVERKILSKALQYFKMTMQGEEIHGDDEHFVERVLEWSSQCRDAYGNGTLDETISTRRCIDIMKAYCIFGNRTDAVKVSVTRFDDSTKDAMLKFYSLVDEKIAEEKKKAEALLETKRKLESLNIHDPSKNPNLVTDSNKFAEIADLLAKAGSN